MTAHVPTVKFVPNVDSSLIAVRCAVKFVIAGRFPVLYTSQSAIAHPVQGYLAHKKQPLPRTLLQAHA